MTDPRSDPGMPTNSRQADEIARLLEQIGIDLEAGGKEAVVRDGFLELPRVPTGENARAARAALGVRRERVPEQDAFTSDAVEVRRLDPRAAVRARVRAAIPVVENDEEDVRALGVGGAGDCRPQNDRKQD